MTPRTPDRKTILKALASVPVPGRGESVVDAGIISSLIFKDGGQVGFAIEVGSLNLPRNEAEALRKRCEEKILALPGVASATIVLTSEAPPKEGVTVRARSAPKGESSPPSPKPLAQVKSLVAVASGKGGVGKSTVASNLAVALARTGLKVGLVDIDILGPSQARMFGLGSEPPTREGRMVPEERYGVRCLSMGQLIREDVPVVWRGPMVSKGMQQLMLGADWGALDVLVMDLPPGTGDILLSLTQQFRIDGAIMVTTPQEVALLDVRKAASMFRKTGVPIMGVVENMSYVEDPSGKRVYLFGKEGGKKFAEAAGLPLLAEIPVYAEISAGGDSGTPVATQKDHPAAALFLRLAEGIAEKLALKKAQP